MGIEVVFNVVFLSCDTGAAPYNAPGHVPGLSHWLFDVITYQYCCLWNNITSMCNIYMGQRPTKDCDRYQSVVAGK